MTSEHVQVLTDATFQTQVLEFEGVAMVDFGADWCIDCRMIQPTVDEIATEYAGLAKICTLDVDAHKATAQSFKIGAIPTLIFFRAGQQVAKLVNVKDKAKIIAVLDDMRGPS